MKQFRNKCTVLLFFCVLLGGEVFAQPFCGDLLIDDFSNSTVGVLNISTINPVEQAVDDGGAGTLGRFRTITLGPFQGGALDTTLIILDNPPAFTLSNDTGVSSPATLLYDADGAGLNANISGREFVNLAFEGIDRDLELSVSLTDSSSNTASLTQTFLDDGNPFETELLFADFSNIQNVDLSNIFSVEIVLQPLQDSADIQLSQFTLECRGTPPEFVAVPVMDRYGFAFMAILLLLIGIVQARKLHTAS